MRCLGLFGLILFAGIIVVGTSEVPGDEGSVPCVYEKDIMTGNGISYNSSNPNCGGQVQKITLEYENVLELIIAVFTEKNQTQKTFSLRVNIADICNIDIHVEAKGFDMRANLSIGNSNTDQMLLYLKDTFIAPDRDSNETLACGGGNALQTAAQNVGWKHTTVWLKQQDEAEISLSMLSWKQHGTGGIRLIRTEAYSPPATLAPENATLPSNVTIQLNSEMQLACEVLINDLTYNLAGNIRLNLKNSESNHLMHSGAAITYFSFMGFLFIVFMATFGY
ncbi:hypothetical protein M3Y95_00766000 [Aphelenchoides besseyi]|nr:hypothetical protein M3Y95_00766000 [Aphelenchoides besseyi]